MDSTTKKRNPWIAALLTFPAPGLGQLYCGRMGRALLFGCINLILSPLLFIFVLKTGVSLKSFFAFQVLEWGFGLAVLADAFLLARREGDNYRMKDINTVSVYVLFSAFVFLGSLGAGLWGAEYLRDTVEGYRIPNSSMSPALQPGDQLMANKKAFLSEDPEHGEIVLFPSPEDRRKTFIKRVVAKEGETIEIRGGSVMVNGKTLPVTDGKEKNRNASYSVQGYGDIPDFGPVTVPKYSVFVMGDNRPNSYDSRNFGPIAVNSLVGKMDSIYWPPHRSGSVEEGTGKE